MKTRRQFLRSSTSCLPLPFLTSLGWRPFVKAAAPTSFDPKMVFLTFGWGVTEKSWFPNQDQTGAVYDLPAGLAPLKKHQADFSIIQNLTNRLADEAHWGSTFYLTGANRYAVPGKSFHNTISADQVAAEQWGLDTRFPSLQLGCHNAKDSGHGPGLSLAWNRRGKPIAGQDDPVKAFHKLFAAPEVSLEEQKAMLKKRASIMDTLVTDLNSMKAKLGKEDQEKLDEYTESIRSIETRIDRDKQWLGKPAPSPGPDLTEPAANLKGYEEIKVMYDILIAALSTGSTRVASYRQPVQSLLDSFGAGMSGHNMSHYNNEARRKVSEKRDQLQSELLSYFFDRMKATETAPGRSLFDESTISYGSNIRSIHYLKNCPTIIAGRGANLNLGQHIVAEQKNTPLANLWLTLLQQNGLDVESHGDSDGVLKSLIS